MLTGRVDPMKLKSAIHHNALRQIDTHVFVEVTSDVIRLLGSVASVEERERAEAVARALVPCKPLENRLEVDPSLQTIDLERAERMAMGGTVAADMISLEEEQAASGLDFSPEPVRIRQDAAFEDSSADELDVPYFPATDPVITMSDGEIEILGGFSSTSLDDLQVALSTDGQVGDEALAEAVQLELREDASTTDLLIAVHVRDGIVYLHGRVPDLLDSDNAVDVASHIPGVDEIVDLLAVASLQ
jgi:osmotically-inducible protein OsmY